MYEGKELNFVILSISILNAFLHLMIKKCIHLQNPDSLASYICTKAAN